MADNTVINAGSGGDTVRDKDRAGIKTQIVGLDVGIGGTEQLMTSAALADTTANPTLPAWASMGMLFNGTTWDRMRGDVTNGLDVDVTRLPALPAGTNNIGDVDVLTLPNVAQATAANLNALVAQGNAGSDAQAWYVRGRRVATYGAGYRLAVATAANTHLTFTFTANTDKQLATIFHAASATKTIRLRRVSIVLMNLGAGSFAFELRALSATTAPATGNPAITPRQYDPADATAEATCLALPTTAGSEAGANSPVSPTFPVNAAAGAAITNTSGVAGEELVLFDMNGGSLDRKPLTVNAGVAGGYAVVGRCTAAVAANYTCYFEFTEE